ncbi:MAG: arginine deiminase [Tissierellia bacterium]|nr:arginine deiminase [Tissierellia bacterium]
MIQVFSEITPLKKVILHRPGRELLNLAPDMLPELLFDEIPYLDKAVEEHDAFADIFRKEGVEVYYLEDLAAKAIEKEQVKRAFIDDFIKESHITSPREEAFVRELLEGLEGKDLILRTMEGIRRETMGEYPCKSLTDFISRENYFITNPMPNLYFTRDPFSLMGTKVSLNRMWSDIRNRETIYGKYIFEHHPDFSGTEFYYKRESAHSIEGGDELIVSQDTIAIGISQRTEAKAVEQIAESILFAGEFKQVLAFVIPKKRAFMHLDTVFTMIDHDCFTVHPEIEGPLEVYSLTKPGSDIVVTKEEGTLEQILGKTLQLDQVRLIRCAGGNPLDASREQWSDGSNTLAIRPGEVIVYDRNTVTNEVLDKAGVKLHVMVSGELSRGRGGPRCMSMPLVREKE